ncbi:FkbM family methyltransferase [bacterium]|nr:FkbM family methyltransferase [bacterium]
MLKLLKIQIRKLLRFYGMGFYKIKSSTRHDMRGALEHLSRMNFYPRTVIDVGVAYGTYSLYRQFPNSTHLLVEPLAEYKSVLEKIMQQYKAEYVLAAAGNRDGTIAINVHPDLSGSTIFKESEGKQVDGISRKVPMVRLDSLCCLKNMPGPYLIKIDTQGAELLVLEGAAGILSETEVIILEVSFFQFYKNGPQFFDVIAWMKKQGFVAYDIYGGQIRPLDGALAQVDMVFIKENGPFRENHYYATPRQREKHTKLISARNPKK